MSMHEWRRSIRLAVVGAFLLLGLLAALPATAQTEGAVVVVETRGPITQVTADHIADAIDEARQTGASAVMIELDTPGGELETTRSIVQELLLSDVPVIVYVAPSGSRAGSAGVFITYAAHVAAMAPGTNIGAATPVDAEGEASVQKILEDTASFAESLAEQRDRDVEFAQEAVREARSVTASTALDIGAIDLIAENREELLDAIDGEEVPLGTGETIVLDTAGAPLVEFEMSFARGILQALANPQLAFIFISIGTLAIIYELANPGVGIGGTIGAIMLILAFYSLSVLPTNFAGMALLVLALALLVGEIFAPGIGVLAGGGTLSLLVAGLLLFDRTQGISLSLAVLLPTVLLAGAGALGVAVLAAKQRNMPPAMGESAMIGMHGDVRTVDNGRGQIFVDGALWQAEAEDGELQEGHRVRVVGREGLTLFVRDEQEQ